MTSRTRLFTAAVSALMGVLVLGACSAESIAELGVEQMIEAQTDGEVDLDFGDGGFSISTEEGDLDIAFDGETGIVFDSHEGGGVIQFDDDGSIRLDSDFGSAQARVDDDGSVVITGDDHDEEFVMSFDAGGGETTMVLDDMVVTTSQRRPDDWPTFLAVPRTLDVASSAFSVAVSEQGFTYSGTFVHDPAENFLAAAEESLEAAGFDRIDTAGLAILGNGSQWEHDALLVVLSSNDGFTIVTAAPQRG